MGILNVTPDSFFSDSRAPSIEEAVRRGVEMAVEGADIIDVGGESTRPGSLEVDEDEELRRVLPVVAELAKELSIPVSIDTGKPGVAARALDAGASVLNDVYALRGGAGMPETAARFPLIVLMHMLGTSPRTMQDVPDYEDAAGEVGDFLEERAARLIAAGGPREGIWVDPGIGFGKTLEHNLELLRALESLRGRGYPVLVGASRKSFIGALLNGGKDPAGVPAELRLEGSLAVACRAAQAGAVCVRVHDVPETIRALDVWAAVSERP